MTTLAAFSAANAALVADLERLVAGAWLASGGDFALLGPALSEVGARHGAMAATVAADWYEAYRDSLGVPGRFRVVLPAQRDQGVPVLLRWAAKEAVSPESVLPLITGGMIRRVLNEGRDTVASATGADPKARGWQRSARGDGCGFCQMLAGRGAVYSKKTVKFASHDNCRCVAVPAFDGLSLPVEPFTPSARKASDADRKRVSDWIAANL